MTDRRLEVDDPLALRALAHPLRVRLLSLVREHRPVTGARLAQLTGESTASVSYHLSILARHGFIEPDPGPALTRRHKPWRTTFDQMRLTGEPGVPPVQSPEGAVLATLLGEVRAQQDGYLAGAVPLPSALQDLATFQFSRLVLTAEQHEQLAADIEAVLARYGEHEEDEGNGETARFSVSFVTVPVGPAEESS